MAKIDIISGFLGAGKTTFIKRLLATKLKDEKVVLIENEYGEVSVDSDMLNDTGIEIKELSQGCICCSLVGDFSKSLNEVIKTYNPDRILIEPSGVGKLSDVVKAVKDAGLEDEINSLVCMVDAKKAKMYDKNFGEFFIDQIKNAQTVILSRTDVCKPETLQQALEIIRKHNEGCVLVTTPISMLTDDELLKAYEGFDVKLLDDFDLEHHDEECSCGCHDHDHHHHDHDEECCCGHDHDHEHHHHNHDEECCCGHDHDHDHHHHDHDEECCCGHGHDHEHHHHDHDEECCCGHNHDHEHHHHEHDEECCCGHDHDHEHHHHDHDEECSCGCHDHEHHHADEVFTSVGIETVKKYDMTLVAEILDKMANGDYGQIVRAKGIISDLDNNWFVFNLTPEEVEILPTNPIHMGKIVVIGSHICEETIKGLF